MIFTGTRFYCGDNTGGVLLQCIKVLPRAKARWGKLGDVMLVTVKKAKPNRKIKKSEKHRALIINTRALIRRSGQIFQFFSNVCVILKKDEFEPLASRINVPASFELRHTGFLRVLTMASFNL